ncbi:MAG: SigE family RNA polymerase sigma factor [Nocardioides sp.]|uniref:SigE family RNA polymerase sigma factor n=1 Tax=Nocardioides sp. TaxID=35761 RepID=UPI00326351E2
MDEEALTFGRSSDPRDGTSLRDVFDASYRRLVVQLYGVTGSLDEAEDLVQEAFVRAAASGRRFLAVDNHEAWLRTTAINAHRSRWRKLRNGRRAYPRMLPPRDPAGLEQHLEIIDALRALPESQRQVIALHYLADLPVDQIADELGVPSGTVKSRLSRGRAALAVQLTAAEGGVDHV